MKRKTIKSLMSPKKIIYVRVHSEWAAQAFFALAKYEGFRLSADFKQRQPVGEYWQTYIINNDKTISIPCIKSWTDSMRFCGAKFVEGKKIVRIDFETMI